MKNNYFFIMLFLTCNLNLFGQDKIVVSKEVGKVSGERFEGISVNIHGEVKDHKNKKWNFLLNSDIEENSHEDPEVEAIKEKLMPQKISSKISKEELNGTAADPVISAKFEGPWMTKGTPPDLSFAISTSGNIVATNNDGIEYYNTSGAYLDGEYWSDFYNDQSLSSKKYDPKIIFDSEKNRFVLIVLHGSKPDVSKVLIAISYTDDPLADGWYYYTIKGDPTSNNLWFDYPSLGLSNADIFITGNLYTEDGKFDRALLLQIDKTTLYNKQSIKYFYYSNLSNDPFNAFSILPVSYGLKGNYGPGMYFVSSKSGGESRLRLWYINDAYSGNPKLFSYEVDVPVYGIGGNAGQYGTSDLLDVGDCRMLSGFYLDGIVHAVHLTNIGDGWNGINYHRISVQSMNAESSNFGLQGSYDYAYPAVASYANKATDKSVMIAFLRSGDDIYPEFRVVHCDQNMDWSSSTLVQEGDTYVDLITSTTERWGDYTGICRQYTNATYPAIWMNGCYGGNVGSLNTYHTFRSKIAKVYAVKTATEMPENQRPVSKTFPLPLKDAFTHEFILSNGQKINIEVLDDNGKLIKKLFNDYLPTGKQTLSFTVDNLNPGIYILNIIGDESYKNQIKIVVAEK